MSNEQFHEEKKKVKLDTLPESAIGEEWDALAGEFSNLVRRSLTLQNRITAIDAEVYAMKKAVPRRGKIRFTSSWICFQLPLARIQKTELKPFTGH